MGRRSRIGVKVELIEDKVSSIELRGTTIVVSEGKIMVYSSERSTNCSSNSLFTVSFSDQDFATEQSL